VAQEIDVWDIPLNTSVVQKMLQASKDWSNRWSASGYNEYEIELGTLMDILKIKRDMEEEALFYSFFGEPGESRSHVWNTEDYHTKEQYITLSYNRMKMYQERCFHGDVTPTVKLSTIHSAKGMEAEVVVIMMTDDGKWSKRDQVQLLINAVCRSSKHIVVTYLPEEDYLTWTHPLSELMLRQGMTSDQIWELGWYDT